MDLQQNIDELPLVAKEKLRKWPLQQVLHSDLIARLNNHPGVAMFVIYVGVRDIRF